ncbi:hypothetical protein [Microbulbifer sp. JMSA008]|uniref:hypothetical protein n=1 Tax=Microbulbifer sp. JMSA008 TaxID=3243373 RepID=UPI00403A1547
MKSFIINLVGLVGSWYLIDLTSENTLNSVFAPLLFTVFLISSVLWFIVKFGITQGSSTGGYFGSDDYGSFGGGDGGVVMVGVKSLNKHMLFAAIAAGRLTLCYSRRKCERL